MSPFYCVRVDHTSGGDTRYQVGWTTDGRDFHPIPSGAFGRPRDAYRYTELRQQAVSPLRASVVDPASPPRLGSRQSLSPGSTGGSAGE
jgi:hypothetical protein